MLIRSLLFFILVLLLTSCCSWGKDWVFLVYLDGDNDLELYNIDDMDEMKRGLQCDNVRIYVQFDRPNGITAKRYKITESGIKELEDIGEVDMADAQTLTDFLNWGKTKIGNAQQTVLILSDHGNGWDQMVGPSPAEKLRQRSLFEDYDSDKKYTPALHNHLVRSAIEAADIDIDVLGLDASIMGTIEAIYEFSGLADIIISSQEVGYAHGWNYADIMSRLSNDPDMSITSFAKKVVDSYRDYFEENVYPAGAEVNDQRYTIAAHRSEGVIKLAQAIGDYASSARLKLEDEATNAAVVEQLQQAREDAQQIDFYNQPRVYVDIEDFFTQLGESEIAALVDEATIASYHGKDRPNANGLSIVFFKLRHEPNPDTSQCQINCNNTYDVNYKDWDSTTETGNKGKFINEFEWDEMMHLYNTLVFPELNL